MEQNFYFLALQSLGVRIAILRVLRFWMLCTLIGSSVGEVIEESVVCELLQTKFFFKWVKKVVVFYIFLDVSCEEFAM